MSGPEEHRRKEVSPEAAAATKLERPVWTVKVVRGQSVDEIRYRNPYQRGNLD